MADEVVQGSWWSGVVRVLVAWLAIALAVWIAAMIEVSGGRRAAMFVLVALLAGSALFSPLYGGVAYIAAKHRSLPNTAKGAMWASIVLFVISAGAVAYGLALLQAVGRGVR